MSRVAKAPISIPSNVEVNIAGQSLSVKGPKGAMQHEINVRVKVVKEDTELKVAPMNDENSAWALAGTTRALVNNMVIGVSRGFEKKLELVGVGYRAQSKGQVINISLGFSHPIDYAVPEGITIETPTQTEILVKGTDKQRVGQVAAEIRGFRPPEPYKGKGVRYSDEVIIRKEAKKK